MSHGSPEPDQRIVWGGECAWWDSVNRAGVRPSTSSVEFTPCCPYCGGPLLSMDTWKEWMDANIEAQEAGHPGHVANLIEMRGNCDRVPRTTKTDPGMFYVVRCQLRELRMV